MKQVKHAPDIFRFIFSGGRSADFVRGFKLSELERIRPENKPIKRNRREEGIEKHLNHLNKY